MAFLKHTKIKNKFENLYYSRLLFLVFKNNFRNSRLERTK